ncbi:MAG: hypothetical protein HYY94_02880 [Gemmatimonadetes bacterium]|nr:hypothetical protein [Gemmatimonadota bacterium]
MRELTIAFSPDADDAFAFYALTQGKVDGGDLALRFQAVDLETLNRKSLEGAFEVTAASFHAYAYMAGKYAILGAGGTFADRHGPLLVGREPVPRDAFGKLLVAIPGTLTTAFLTLRLVEPDIAFTLKPIDRILDAVESGETEAGLVKYEAQLTYGERGLPRRSCPCPWAASSSAATWANPWPGGCPPWCAPASSTPWATVPKRWPTPCPTPPGCRVPWPSGISGCT